MFDVKYLILIIISLLSTSGLSDDLATVIHTIRPDTVIFQKNNSLLEDFWVNCEPSDISVTGNSLTAFFDFDQTSPQCFFRALYQPIPKEVNGQLTIGMCAGQSNLPSFQVAWLRRKFLEIGLPNSSWVANSFQPNESSKEWVNGTTYAEFSPGPNYQQDFYAGDGSAILETALAPIADVPTNLVIFLWQGENDAAQDHSQRFFWATRWNWLFNQLRIDMPQIGRIHVVLARIFTRNSLATEETENRLNELRDQQDLLASFSNNFSIIEVNDFEKENNQTNLGVHLSRFNLANEDQFEIAADRFLEALDVPPSANRFEDSNFKVINVESLQAPIYVNTNEVTVDSLRAVNAQTTLIQSSDRRFSLKPQPGVSFIIPAGKLAKSAKRGSEIVLSWNELNQVNLSGDLADDTLLEESYVYFNADKELNPINKTGELAHNEELAHWADAHGSRRLFVAKNGLPTLSLGTSVGSSVNFTGKNNSFSSMSNLKQWSINQAQQGMTIAFVYEPRLGNRGDTFLVDVEGEGVIDSISIVKYGDQNLKLRVDKRSSTGFYDSPFCVGVVAGQPELIIVSFSADGMNSAMWYRGEYHVLPDVGSRATGELILGNTNSRTKLADFLIYNRVFSEDEMNELATVFAVKYPELDVSNPL